MLWNTLLILTLIYWVILGARMRRRTSRVHGRAIVDVPRLTLCALGPPGILLALVLMMPAMERSMLEGMLDIARDRLAPFPRLSADSAQRIIAAAEASSGTRIPCARVSPSDRIVTRGDITAGNWSVYRNSWIPGGGKLWWRMTRPASSGGDEPILKVQAIRLDKPLPLLAERNSVSSRINLSPVARHADTVIFTLSARSDPVTFPSGVRVPAPGQWLFIASAPGNWGCFIFRV